jgi:hypothetical protein
MAIEEEIRLKDGVSDPAIDAAGAVNDLADAFRKSVDAMGDLDFHPVKATEAAKAYEQLAASVEKSSTAAKRWQETSGQGGRGPDWRSIGKNAKGATTETNRAGKAANASGKKVEMLGEAFEIAGIQGAGRMKQLGGALGKLGPVAVGVAVAVGLIGAGTKAIYELSSALLKAAGSASIAREGLRAALDQVTGSRGDQALTMLDDLASKLNLSVDAATQAFISFRKEGLDNVSSEAFLKLQADIQAVDGDAGEMNAAFQAAFKDIKDGVETPASAIQKIADHFMVAGDGATAAAHRVYTLEGALDNAGKVSDRLWARVADKAQPAFDKAGEALTGFLDHFEKSEAAQKAIDGLAKIISKVVDAGIRIAEKVAPGIEELFESFGKLGDALGNSEGSFSAVNAIANVFANSINAVVWAIDAVVSAVTFVINVWNQFSSAVSIASDSVSGALDAVLGFADGFMSAGISLVEGFISGMTSMVGNVVASAANLGTEAAAALAASLGISSPSKVAMALGENVGLSFGDAMNDALPEAIISDAPPAANSQGSQAAGSSAAVNLTVHVNIGGNDASPADIQSAVTRGALEALQLAGVAS